MAFTVNSYMADNYSSPERRWRHNYNQTDRHCVTSGGPGKTTEQKTWGGTTRVEPRSCQWQRMSVLLLCGGRVPM